jgi:hypothetical protein
MLFLNLDYVLASSDFGENSCPTRARAFRQTCLRPLDRYHCVRHWLEIVPDHNRQRGYGFSVSALSQIVQEIGLRFIAGFRCGSAQERKKMAIRTHAYLEQVLLAFLQPPVVSTNDHFPRMVRQTLEDLLH